MNEQEALLAALSVPTAYFVGGASLRETLTRVAELSRHALGVPAEVGVTLFLDRRPATYVVTDPVIFEVDRAQYDADDGPCLKARSTGVTVLIPSTPRSVEHRRFCAVATRHGILSVASFPLATPAGLLGAMNHYAGREEAFGPAEIELAERFAAQAGYLLANVRPYSAPRPLREGLIEAVGARAAIEEAKQVIMARFDTDEDDAFARLREQAQAQNRTVSDVAKEIIRGARGRRRTGNDSGS